MNIIKNISIITLMIRIYQAFYDWLYEKLSYVPRTMKKYFFLLFWIVSLRIFLISIYRRVANFVAYTFFYTTDDVAYSEIHVYWAS